MLTKEQKQKTPSYLEVKLAEFLETNTDWRLVYGSLKRTYVGRHQKCAGAWLWWSRVKEKDCNAEMDVGSQYPLTHLMRITPNIDVEVDDGGLHIEPMGGYEILSYITVTRSPEGSSDG